MNQYILCNFLYFKQKKPNYTKGIGAPMQKKMKDFQTFHRRVRIILTFFYFDLIFTILSLVTFMINSKYSKFLFYVFISLGILCLIYTIILTKKNRNLIFRAEELFFNASYGPSMDKLKKFQNLIENNLFIYHFQPIVNAKTGEIFAYEALMRTDPNTIGLEATEILDLATREDFLYDIEKYTFFNILELMKENAELFRSKKLFINSISSHQLTDEDFNSLYQAYGSQFTNVVIEITESTPLSEKGIQLINTRLEQTNFQLALDDYGTGYSNESNLLNSNPSYIKIDGSLLRYIHLDSKKQHLVTSLVNFAVQNHIKVIAEGIETYEELEFVLSLGIDYIQGYYTACPSKELLRQIPKNILDQIQEINSRNLSGTSVEKLYETHDDKILSPVAIALDLYSDIIVRDKELCLQGNQGMIANISVLIPDNHSCILTLEQLNLRGNEKPSIIIGNNSDVILRLVGDNYISYDGIRVPETSSLKIIGDGNLIIQAERSNRVGIGGTALQAYGNITLASTGIIKVISSGNMSIGIGGGQNPCNSFIHIASGNIYIETSGSNTVGIGSIAGNAKITIEDGKLKLLTEGTKAIGIGSIRGSMDLVSSGNLVIKCTGKNIVAVGTMEEGDGRITIQNGVVNISYSCYNGTGIGALGGRVNIEILRGDITINGEGSEITGIGDHTGLGDILIKNGIISTQLYASNAIPIGNIKRHVVIDGGNIQCDFPDDISLTNSFGTALSPRIIMDTDEFRQVIDTVSYSYEYLASYSDRYPYIKVFLPEGINY